MTSKNNSFDPLVFLSLFIDKIYEKSARSELLDLLTQYFVIKFIELLPEQEVKSVSNIAELFELAQRRIPSFEEKVKQIAEDFKREYRTNRI